MKTITRSKVFLDKMEADKRTFLPSGLSKNLNMKEAFVCTSRTHLPKVKNVNESNLLCRFVTFPFQKHSCVSHNSFTLRISSVVYQHCVYGCASRNRVSLTIGVSQSSHSTRNLYQNIIQRNINIHHLL